MEREKATQDEIKAYVKIKKCSELMQQINREIEGMTKEEFETYVTLVELPHSLTLGARLKERLPSEKV